MESVGDFTMDDEAPAPKRERLDESMDVDTATDLIPANLPSPRVSPIPSRDSNDPQQENVLDHMFNT